MTPFATAVLAVLACAPRAQPDPAVAVPPAAQPPAVQETAAVPQTITGSAQDAKGGAMILADGGRAYYVVGLASWPAHALGKPVRVIGQVGTARHVPEAVVGPDGGVSQGVAPGSAPDDVIQDFTWVLVDAPPGAEPAPWRLTVADGSANVTAVWQDAADGPVMWSYDPVRPEESSTGSYSGGAPAQGTADSAQVAALWQTVRTLEGWPAVHTAQRSKGTVAVTIVSPVGDRGVLVAMGEHLGALNAAVAELRADAAVAPE